jgi:hypothetical protein
VDDRDKRHLGATMLQALGGAMLALGVIVLLLLVASML